MDIAPTAGLVPVECTATGSAAPSAPGQDVSQLPGTLCRITGFLGPAVSSRVLERAMATAPEKLSPSEVGSASTVVPHVRRSRMDRDFDAVELTSAIGGVLGTVEAILGVRCHDTFPDCALVAHNDGDFFLPHQDRHPGNKDERVVTFVYYLHRTPRPFSGGQLRIYNTAAPHSGAAPWWEIEPDHDSIVFLDPAAVHEVRRVTCPSREHADSRFALTGWLYRPVA